jgi:hypothetical protein
MTNGKPYPSDVSDEEWAFVVLYLALVREDAPQRNHAICARSYTGSGGSCAPALRGSICPATCCHGRLSTSRRELALYGHNRGDEGTAGGDGGGAAKGGAGARQAGGSLAARRNLSGVPRHARAPRGLAPRPGARSGGRGHPGPREPPRLPPRHLRRCQAPVQTGQGAGEDLGGWQSTRKVEAP